MTKKIILIAVFMQTLTTIFAQTLRDNGLMIGVGTYINGNPKLSYYTTCEYNWSVSKFFILSTGGRLVYSKIDEFWNNGSTTYSFNKNIFKLNSISSIKFNLPVYKSFGLESSAQFIFEPIPLGVATLNINSNNNVENRTKYVFTKFNPGYLINLGFYKDITNVTQKVRFSFGFGYGWYDVYKDYRIANFGLQKQVIDNTFSYNIYLNIAVF